MAYYAECISMAYYAECQCTVYQWRSTPDINGVLVSHGDREAEIHLQNSAVSTVYVKCLCIV